MALMVLRLFEDHMPAAVDSGYLPARNRALHVAEGDITVEFATGCARHGQGSAWGGGRRNRPYDGSSGCMRVALGAGIGGSEDTGLLRAAPGCTSMVKLAEQIDLGEAS